MYDGTPKLYINVFVNVYGKIIKVEKVPCPHCKEISDFFLIFYPVLHGCVNCDNAVELYTNVIRSTEKIGKVKK